MLVLGFTAAVWYLFAPSRETQALLTTLDSAGIGSWLTSRGLIWPFVGASALLLSEVVSRSDYIDAYLPLGPAKVARYGY